VTEDTYDEGRSAFHTTRKLLQTDFASCTIGRAEVLSIVGSAEAPGRLRIAPSPTSTLRGQVDNLQGKQMELGHTTTSGPACIASCFSLIKEDIVLPNGFLGDNGCEGGRRRDLGTHHIEAGSRSN
jgi:hypothetical protein